MAVSPAEEEKRAGVSGIKNAWGSDKKVITHLV
jgi:hypothetical protein